mmetsp:Transcript_35931/g.84113  ORF Transcript_35931/g.84113 Transcript_35931/m.84113 type:complete len:941 (-) Transcript_35931:206-3028(-)
MALRGLLAVLGGALAWGSYGHLPEVELHGSGTTNPSKFYWDIMETFTASTLRRVILTYRAVGSGTGQREFSQVSDGDYSAGLSDFGSGDIPMSQTHYDAMAGQGRTMVHVPFALGAIGIFHSVPVGEVGNEGLKLSPCTLAKIFSGQITEWNHNEILADNPSMQGQIPAGTKIQVGHRSLGSSSTGGLTGYLEKTCPTSWLLGSGSTITWPNLDNFNAVQGSPGMTEHVASTKYAIGYLDAGHGHQRGFSETQLRNADGTWLTSLDAMGRVDGDGNNGIAAAGAAGVQAGAIPADASADWSAVNLYDQAGVNTWPIVLVSYLYIYGDMSSWSIDKVSLLKSFVDYVTDPAKGQVLSADYSFNSIPSAMNTWSTAGGSWETLVTKPTGYADVFTFEDSTTPWVGQGENVISVKRNSFSLWKLSELALANEQLEARVDALENHLSEYGIVPLHGSGTTNPRNWFAKVMKQMEHRARVPLMLTYRAVGSSTGQKEFVGQESNGYNSYNHFGAGDIPMAADRYATLQTNGVTMLHLPFALGALGVFHSVPMNEVGSDSLKLDGCLLAKIFSGKITSWNDPEIVAKNPGMSVPAATELIRVGHRTLGSSSTGGLSGYLDKKCSAEWGLSTGSTIAWPTSAGFTAVQGSQGMQAHIDENPYAIGYLDAGHGHDFGMSEVALENLNGMTRTSKEAIALTPSGVAEAGNQGVNANAFPAQATGDWSAVNLFDMPGDNTWPIVLVSYLYVKRDQTDTNPRTAAALQAFLDRILNNAEDIASEFGFTVSPALQTLSLNAAAQVIYPANMESFMFESSTTAYDGMGVNVISVKRNAFDDYERDVLAQEIEALKMRATALEAPAPTAPTTMSTTAGMTQPMTTMATMAPSIEYRTVTEEEDSSTGTIALVIAILAVLLSAGALGMGCMTFMRLPKNGESGLAGGGNTIGASY